jgi:hypothetical protein
MGGNLGKPRKKLGQWGKIFDFQQQIVKTASKIDGRNTFKKWIVL